MLAYTFHGTRGFIMATGAAPAQSLPPGSRLRGGRYRVTEVIGRGGFSIVYRATTRSGDSVAIKELFPPEARRKSFLGLWTRQAVRKTADWRDQLRRARDEFRLVEGMAHPNIVRVHELFAENGTLYIVMDDLAGLSLHDHLSKSGGALGEADAVVVGTALAEALAYAHARGVVHRDVKPGNVMVCDDGRVVLLDFGIARSTRGPEVRSAEGTHGAMAPEQVRGGKQTKAVDVYGLGATVYQALTGVAPPRAEARLRGTPLVPPRDLAPGVSAAASAAVVAALELDPRDRPRSVVAFAQELRGVPRALAAQAVERGGRWHWWKPVAIVTMLALAALALAIAQG